jgi:CRP-like cAMP-binding protein
MRPEDLVRHLSDSSFFHGLAPEERLSMARLGRLTRHAPGEALFRPGQPPGALILVIEGLAEICRAKRDGGSEEPVAYAGPGTVLAESKVITGTPYGSTARFPEGGVTLQWPRAAILRRLVASQEFSMQYLQHVARRLEGSLSGMDAARSRLEGSLTHFDLPTILQTVVESGSRGVVEIRSARGNLHGSMHIADRLVGPIYCGTLVGSDAFIEILVTPPDEGTFTIDPSKPTAEGRFPVATGVPAVRIRTSQRRVPAVRNRTRR